MVEFAQDQAEGLRRLLAHDFVRVVTVTSGRRRAGKTSIVLNLAVALARCGKNVLVLDEQAGKGNIDAMLGLKPHFDLLHVIRREKTLDEVIMQGPEGVQIVPAAQGVRKLAQLSVAEQEWLVQSFSHLPKAVDVVLVDAVAGIAGNVLSLSLAAQEVVVVVSGEAASITDAYAMIKVLRQDYAKQRFHIVVSKAKTEGEAQAIFNNMAQAANRYLDVSLEYMGYVPLDEKLRQSARIFKPVVEAFPASPSGTAFRRLAEAVDRWPHPKDDSGRLDTFLQRLIISSRMTEQGVRL